MVHVYFPVVVAPITCNEVCFGAELKLMKLSWVITSFLPVNLSVIGIALEEQFKSPVVGRSPEWLESKGDSMRALPEQICICLLLYM